MSNDKKKAEKPAEKKVEKKKKLPEYYVKMGKSLSTRHGIIADGKEIKPEWVHGGKDTLEKFVESGHIGKG